MPGIKRKAGGSVGAAPVMRKNGNGVGKEGKWKADEKAASDEEDDFDDGDDLMASALAEQGVEEAEFSGEEEMEEDGGEREVDMFSDEDLEGGFEDVAAEDAVAGPSSSKSANQHPSLYAIPSRDEMSTLKNASELYKSNIFKLKIEEMLGEVRPKYDKSGSLDYALRRIKAVLESLPSIEPQPLKSSLDALSRTFDSRKLQVPFPDPQPKEDSPLKYAFEKPSRVQVVGSWILKTAALRPEGVDVDVVLTMPSSLFQEKDHLNMRYFHKRAFYLAGIGAALQKEEDLGLKCQFAHQEDDVRRPYLILKADPNGSQSDFTKLKSIIKIHLAHETDLFPVRRLGPSRNNMRMEGLGESNQPATPSYNASVLADSLYSPHLIYLNSTSQSSGSFAEACMLLKTWSLQRVFGSGPSKAEVKGKVGRERGRRVGSGSNGIRFLLSMLLAHLLHGPEKTTLTGSKARQRLSPGFSSYQLFKGTIDFLATHDFVAQPVWMKTIEGVISRRDMIESSDFGRTSTPVLVDPTGSINLLEKMDMGTYRLLQAEARATLAMLNDAEEDRFEDVFLRDRSKPSFLFDQIIKVDLRGVKGAAEAVADMGSPLCASIASVSATLTRALNKRARLLTWFAPSTAHWQLDCSRPKLSWKVELGIQFEASQAFRLVDHGPRPEDQVEAQAFKAFWGELAELRRFRDGRIVESIVWSLDASMDRTRIPLSIISHSLQRHHHIQPEQLSFFSDAFQGLLLPNEKLAKEAYLSLPSEAGFQTVQSAFDDVAKSLRRLEGLPLSLISVVGADAGLRSMSAMVPSPLNLNTAVPGTSSYLPSQEFVITLESSGRWPDDLAAIQAMKVAFYETMATKLVDSLDGCKTAVVFDKDAEENELWDCAGLEIILSSGLAFVGRIHQERERLLLNRIIQDKDEDGHVKSQAKAALSRFEIRFEHNVRHHNHMAALVHRFESLGSAVRLLKRWVSSQMVALDVPDQLCELVVASVYIQASESGLVPATGHAGFLQSLQRLSEWEWREQPLVVAMSGATSSTPVCALSTEAKQTVQASFEQVRKLDPGLNHFAWFIATESELAGSSWGKRHPTAATADALQRLAHGACHILAAGPHLSQEAVKSIFVPALGHFDFVIHLEPGAVNRYLDNVNYDGEIVRQSGKSMVKSKYRNLSLSTPSSPQAGLNLGLEFARLLESLYLDSMRLYYDVLGGIVIGGLFNPLLAKPRPFRVGLGFNSRPADDSTKDVTLNHADIIAEIERLGTGLVQRVEWVKPV